MKKELDTIVIELKEDIVIISHSKTLMKTIMYMGIIGIVLGSWLSSYFGEGGLPFYIQIPIVLLFLYGILKSSSKWIYYKEGYIVDVSFFANFVISKNKYFCKEGFIYTYVDNENYFFYALDFPPISSDKLYHQINYTFHYGSHACAAKDIINEFIGSEYVKDIINEDIINEDIINEE